MTAAAPEHVTVEEYLRLEMESPVKHELVGGLMYAMTGASARHVILCRRIASAVGPAAEERGCRAYQSDMKVQIGESYYYPDVMVACGDLPDPYFETAPCLLVEVVSPSTATTDRREKVGAYTSIPELRAYLVVESALPSIWVHQRMGARWTSRAFGPGEDILLECPLVRLNVDALYASLPPQP